MDFLTRILFHFKDTPYGAPCVGQANARDPVADISIFNFRIG
jgi:hypothetical protein